VLLVELLLYWLYWRFSLSKNPEIFHWVWYLINLFGRKEMNVRLHVSELQSKPRVFFFPEYSAQYNYPEQRCYWWCANFIFWGWCLDSFLRMKSWSMLLCLSTCLSTHILFFSVIEYFLSILAAVLILSASQVIIHWTGLLFTVVLSEDDQPHCWLGVTIR